MNRLPQLTARLVLTAALVSAPAAAQSGQPALQGTTSGLSWTLHEPGRLLNLSSDMQRLHLAPPPRANVIGAKYDRSRQTAVIAYRSDRPLREAFEFHDQQLRQQGYERLARDISNDGAVARYSRGNDEIKLVMSVTDRQNRVFRVNLDLSGVQAGGQQGAAQHEHEEVPMVEVNDQPVTNRAVNITEVVTEEPAWVVIHAANTQGNPGEVLGQTRVQSGETYGVKVNLSRAVDPNTKLFVMLHRDTGESGVYEFGRVEGADPPMTRDGNVVVKPFTVQPANQGGNTGNTSGSQATGNQAQQGSTQAAQNTENTLVEIEDFAYNPAEIRVPAGTTVRWVNRDSVPHTVTSREGDTLASGNIAPGEEFTHTFTEPGRYPYYCTIHPRMEGVVIVEEAGN